jgi:hypothetical protein
MNTILQIKVLVLSNINNFKATNKSMKKASIKRIIYSLNLLQIRFIRDLCLKEFEVNFSVIRLLLKFVLIFNEII